MEKENIEKENIRLRHTLLGGRRSGGDFTYSNLNIIREGRTLAHELHNTHRALASPGGGDARAMPNPFESVLGCAGHSNPCLAVYYSYYSHVFMHFHHFHSSPYTTTRANAR